MNDENKEVQVQEEENRQGGVRKNLRLRNLRNKLMMALMVALMLTASASADPLTGMENVMAQSTNVTTLLGLVFDFITGNALLATFVLFGLVGAAVRLFRRGKRAAR